jgi:hypothetical protein
MASQNFAEIVEGARLMYHSYTIVDTPSQELRAAFGSLDSQEDLEAALREHFPGLTFYEMYSGYYVGLYNSAAHWRRCNPDADETKFVLLDSNGWTCVFRRET